MTLEDFVTIETKLLQGFKKVYITKNELHLNSYPQNTDKKTWNKFFADYCEEIEKIRNGLEDETKFSKYNDRIAKYLE